MQRADWKRLNICAKRHIPLHKEPPESGRKGNGNQRKGIQELRRESYLSRGRTGFGGVGGEGERGRNEAEVGASAQVTACAQGCTFDPGSGVRPQGLRGRWKPDGEGSEAARLWWWRRSKKEARSEKPTV